MKKFCNKKCESCKDFEILYKNVGFTNFSIYSKSDVGICKVTNEVISEIECQEQHEN